MAKPVIDPWLLNADGTPDPFSQAVDYGMTAKDEVDPDLQPIEPHGGLDPQIIANQPPAPSEETPVETPPAPVVEPEPEGPEVFELPNGGTVTRTKEKGQWKAVLDPGTGANPEVFWGKNKDELLVSVLTGKLEATKKIRELNKKVKLTAPAAPRQVQQPPQPSVRDLTADESFEIKALWDSNPAAALDLLVKKRTNLTLEDLVAKANRGDQANISLETEAITREFIEKNPDYYTDPRNADAFLKWLAKFKLGKNVTETNSGEILTELWTSGNFTVENLEEAFQDLTDDGLLVKPRLPKTPPPVEVLPEPVPAPAPPNTRIVKTETRPRAALGIRNSDVSATPPPQTPTAPTDEDLENLPDEQISALLRGVRKMKAQQARRSN
jgi:hypothetical protein